MTTEVVDRKTMCREAVDSVMCAYVQVPFCGSLCRFCCWANWYDSRQLLGIKRHGGSYVSALKREIVQRSRIEAERERVDLKVIHFGGGTPSMLTVEELADVLDTLLNAYGISRDSVDTIGVEVRADSVSPEKLEGMREIGFNRMSIGAQSFNAEILRGVGRRQTPDEFYTAYSAARKAGFEDMNIDLLFGLPGQTSEIAERDAEIAVELGPEHIDAHPWKPVFDKKGQCLVEGGWSREQKVETVLTQKRIFESAGYENYNHRLYCRPGHENLMHLIEATYLLPTLSFGAGAEQYAPMPTTTRDIEAYSAEGFVPAYMAMLPASLTVAEHPSWLADRIIRQLLLPEGLWVPGFDRRHHCDVVDKLQNGWKGPFEQYFHLYAGGDLYSRSRLQILRKLQDWFERGIIYHEDDWLRLATDYQISNETWVLYMSAC